jgi:hypothetical protein
MRAFPLLLLLAPCFTCLVGCTNLSLQRHTLAHIETIADLRYREVLENLALIDAVPASLPFYATIYTGTTRLSDQQMMTSSAVFGREAVTKGSVLIGTMTRVQQGVLDTPMQRQVVSNWTLDPITGPEKLLAMRAACKWVLCGPDSLDDAERQIVKGWDPEAHMPPGHYFDFEKDLKKLPCDWLGRGCLAQVPVHAAHVAHYHDRWVWVMPEGMEGLSAFSLIMSNIARLKTDEMYFPKAETRTVSFVDATPRNNPKMKVTVTAYADREGRLVAGEGKTAEPVKLRLENITSDTALRSTINAAAATK